MSALIIACIQLGLSGVSLFVLAGSFILGAKYKLIGTDSSIALCTAVAGLVGGVLGIWMIGGGGSLIWAAALLVGAFLTGLGLGLHVTERLD